MHIVITGGAGFLGGCLARQLLKRGQLTGSDGRQQTITRISLIDVVPAQGFNDARIELVIGDISDTTVLERAIHKDTQSIFHLAAIVSGHAEANFELGMKINFEATRVLLERARLLGSRPRVVFTSSVAVFGGELPEIVPDNAPLMPQSSYGAQKVMGELLINDYSRKGYIDGRSLRMPTISVRPGVPNRAVSSFTSGIIREPLNGQPSICPVSPGTRMWLMSPRKAVDNLIHGHEINGADLGLARFLTIDGLSVTVRQMVDALGQVAGANAPRLIEWKEDELIERMVNSWPGNFEAKRAKALGFVADSDFISIVKEYVEDEMKN